MKSRHAEVAAAVVSCQCCVTRKVTGLQGIRSGDRSRPCGWVPSGCRTIAAELSTLEHITIHAPIWGGAVAGVGEAGRKMEPALCCAVTSVRWVPRVTHPPCGPAGSQDPATSTWTAPGQPRIRYLHVSWVGGSWWAQLLAGGGGAARRLPRFRSVSPHLTSSFTISASGALVTGRRVLSS